MRFAVALLALVGLASTADAQQSRTVSGSLTYRERMALPPEAEMLLELREASGAVVTHAQRPTEGAQVPLPFALDAPADRALSLRAALRLGGEIRFLGGPVDIEAGQDAVDIGEVLLRGYRPMGFSSMLSCGEVRVELGFVGQGARLRIGGTYLDLVPERTASGSKFVAADAPDTWVWTKGDLATLSLNGTQLPECRAALPSDSYAARGNEPGWRLEIAGGQMRYVGDYGETEIAAPLPEPELAEGARRYAPEGVDLVLTLGQALCHDDMTGMPYPDRAVVESGGRSLRGCGGDPMALLSAHPWRVEDIDGRGLVDRSNVTLAVAPDGGMSGAAGCNRYTGGVRLTGEGLRVGPVGATMMACAEALMTQERRFFDALARATRFDIADDGALQLFAGDDPVITARR
ncbi:Membrane-bound lysozyme-inhibitor of c-type lysozyme [Rhodovulum sp. ES.010]|uniref:META domain-containing protein n=1 Tax=Rhodovulum sp. ES.010 TaxID=1882821 RepID=UPI0009276028|nr:META domain-containing protein [Rhodovulum sp. ES.010]SIO02161.1 Membrane-bound lysozyme-inhibitor of c-type lysozyme [Rhodovulum sp. ES.010]